MTFRRVLGAGLAAVLAAGPVLALPMTGAVAAVRPHYVAVVISGHGSHCVRWTSGITGDTVLNDVASVAYRSDGIIVQIDGSPAAAKADNTHYWSYWHDTQGTWTYSNFGASSSTPAAGTVEGWSYDNGKTSAPKPSQNPSGLYAKLCGAKDQQVVTVPRTPATSTPARSSRAAARSTAPASTSPSGAPSSHAPSSPNASSHTASSHPPSATRTASSSAAVSPTPTTVGPTSAPASAAPATIDASPTASSSSSGSPVGLIVAVAVVVVLGAGAGAFALRRRAGG